MKIINIVLFILIITTAPALAQLYEDPRDKGGPEPNVMARALPRWRSSLGDIQQSASALLDRNAGLMEEYDRLQALQGQLNDKMEALRSDNARVSQEVSSRQKVRKEVDPVEMARLKELSVRHVSELKLRKEALEAGRLRLASYEARLAVLRIQAKEADVNRQARDVDLKAHDAARIQAVIQESELLRSRTKVTVQQLSLLREKTAELEKVRLPDSPEARVLLSSLAQLKERAAELSAMKVDLQARLAPSEETMMQAGAQARVKRLRQLVSRRDEVQLSLKENTRKLDDLKSMKMDDFSAEPSMDEQDFKKVERQNSFIEDEIGNLRENIALLEYKVTTLERYRDRHSPPEKKK